MQFLKGAFADLDASAGKTYDLLLGSGERRRPLRRNRGRGLGSGGQTPTLATLLEEIPKAIEQTLEGVDRG